MTTPQPDPEPLLLAIHRTHRSVLVLLALCALMIFARGFGGEEPPPDRLITVWAVGLALVGILLRRAGTSPQIQPRTALMFGLAGLVSSAALGLLGAYLAWTQGAAQTGLVYTLAGGIFALRAPVLPSPQT
jgi:hypothetical protein